MSYATNRSEALQRRIDDAIAEGWKIESETPDRVVLVKRNFGDLGVHILIALLTAWWAFGVVNVVYGAYKYLNDARRQVLRETRTCPECDASVSADADYCRNCGADLPDPSTGATTCAECGESVPPGANYCGTCGAEVAASA